jgi:hypothetical protein
MKGYTMANDRVIRLACVCFILIPLIVTSEAVFRTAAAQPQSFSGFFTVMWGDPRPGSNVGAMTAYFLSDDQGNSTEVLIDERVLESLGGALAFNGKRVKILGENVDVVSPTASHGSILVRKIRAQWIERDSGMAPMLGTELAAVAGPQRWINVLCRFADIPSTPQTVSYFEELMSSVYPGMDHYWREVSYEQINLTGTEVSGWHNLPQPRSYYADGSLGRTRAVEDCTAAADTAVFFPNFTGINLIFNEVLDCCAWGGSRFLTRDGESKIYRVTWLPPWGWQNQSVVAHEMGHGFGLPHSSGPYTTPYDSRWDVMSDTWGNCSTRHALYGCIGVHTIARHKDILGWIPPSLKYVAELGTSQTIFIERLGQPVFGDNYRMAEIPIGYSGTPIYTVEARQRVGYDRQVPGDAIVIHKVNPSGGDRSAQVVDIDNNGDPDDAAAMWTPGETFTDAANGISVSVISAGASGFLVNITVNDLPPLVTIFATQSVAWELGQRAGTFRIERVGGLASPLTVNYAVTGTATPGSDYASLPGSVVIPAGASFVQFNVAPIDDTLAETNETITATLLPHPSYSIGTFDNIATVTLISDDISPTVRITATDPTATEAGLTTGTFTVTRTGSTASALTVVYAVGGTAAAGEDYFALPGNVTIPAGSSTATVTVRPIDDTFMEWPQTVILTLAPSGSYSIGSPSNATVSIASNETVRIVATDATATEAGRTTGTFTVSRTSTTIFPLRVFYGVGGTAKPGIDYLALPGSVLIPVGAVSAPVVITPIDDASMEGPETITLTLLHRSPYLLGTPSSATVTLASNELVTVTATDPTATEAGTTTGTFTVKRTGNVAAPITVRYTVSGTAKPGADYVALSGAVTIPTGATSAAIVVRPLNDTTAEINETVIVRLAPNAAYTVGAPSSATVTITSNE